MSANPSTTAASASLAGGEIDLDASRAHCREIVRLHARNFYYGMKLTPEPKRSAMYAIYAWMRAADDLADDAGTPAEKERRLDAFRRRTCLAVDPTAAPLDDDAAHAPIWPAVRRAFIDYHVPLEHLHAMIDGQMLDQRMTRYTSYAELDDYCYKVAGVVGLVCIAIWGHDGGEEARRLAVVRGSALQLTNILRDVVEDAQRDRVYLPAEELVQYGYRTPDEFRDAVLSGQIDDRFDRLMRFQAGRARKFYEESSPLDAFIDPSCRACSWSIMRIYRGLLDKIEADPRRVLAGRVRLNKFTKVMIALRATMR
ncbi:MAG: phytoene/squalene synthase family protein [Planctomycetes bacterium]|nr:phytoene/squalene synthase family protein [Planctomycetota bacterium]